MLIDYIVMILENLVACLVMLFTINENPMISLYINGILGIFMIVYLIIKFKGKYIPFNFILIQASTVIIQLLIIYVLEKYTSFSIISIYNHTSSMRPFTVVSFLLIDLITMVQIIGVNLIKYLVKVVKGFKGYLKVLEEEDI